MNWPGFYALGSAWLFALTVPVVAFYFLKLKRPRQEISSTLLWQQVIQDQRVNSPFQRFKRNILLFLQLLLLMLLALAAMQPYWRGRTERIRRLPILIDCSASMAALDKVGGTSRLSAAKGEVRKLIDNILPDEQLCLISFDRSARKLIGFTNNKKLLRQALDNVSVRDVPGSADDALRMAQALARGVAFDEVLLLSDGNFPTRTDFELSFKLNYHKLPGAGPNVGITSLNAVRTQDDKWDVFARLEASPDAKTTAMVEVTRDGEVLLSEDVSLAGGTSERLVFRVGGRKEVSIKLTVLPDNFDSLASDNVASLELPATRPLRIHVPPGMSAYRHALAPIERVRIVSGDGPYDLLITDRPEDRELAALVCLYVGMVPPELSKLLEIEDAGGQVVDWRRDVPLLRHVELGELVLVRRPTLKAGVQETDFENLHYEILVHGDRGPLLLSRRSGRIIHYHMLFHSNRSTFPYRVGFPVMVSNLVKLASRQAGLEEVQAAHTGVLPALAVGPGTNFTVRAPDGSLRAIVGDARGNLVGISAPYAGDYEINGDDGTTLRVGASLLHGGETSLKGVQQILFNEELSVAAQSGAAPADRALWPTLAMLAFVILLVEWWYFQRTPRWIMKVK